MASGLAHAADGVSGLGNDLDKSGEFMPDCGCGRWWSCPHLSVAKVNAATEIRISSHWSHATRNAADLRAVPNTHPHDLVEMPRS